MPGDKPSKNAAFLRPPIHCTSAVVAEYPGSVQITPPDSSFYRPSLTIASDAHLSYGEALPTTLTLSATPRIDVSGHQVSGAFTLGPEGLQFGSGGATLRVEFSEDDVAAFGASYTDFVAVRMTYPPGYPSSCEAATKEIVGSDTPVPIRVDSNRQIYGITVPYAQINSTYGAIPLSAVPVTVSRFMLE